MNMADQNSLFRKIPAVDQLLLRPAIIACVERTSREFVVSEIQKLLQVIRDRILSGDVTEPEFSPENIEAALSANRIFHCCDCIPGSYRFIVAVSD